MFCGAGSFSHANDDLPASPRPGSLRKADRNPYSARGLEKFSAVQAELEAKRERILKNVGSRGVDSVRFTYTDSSWVPIILKQPPQESKEEKKRGKKSKSPPLQQISELSEKAVEEPAATEPVHRQRSAPRREKASQWQAYYWMLLAMILVCLALFGRTFAICCTSMFWYLMPMTWKGSGTSPRKRLQTKVIGGGSLAACCHWWCRSF